MSLNATVDRSVLAWHPVAPMLGRPPETRAAIAPEAGSQKDCNVEATADHHDPRRRYPEAYSECHCWSLFHREQPLPDTHVQIRSTGKRKKLLFLKGLQTLHGQSCPAFTPYLPTL
jgi:hypothetical protein